MYIISILCTVGLWILGAVYELVSYAYKLFILMCSINLSVLSDIMSPIIDRLEALVMVFVVFKVGVALINYMLEPEKAMKDGTKLVVSILITAGLLIGRNFVFDVFNELSLLIMGNPTGYPFSVLSTVANVTDAKDEGLIMRFVFDNNAGAKEDIGDYLAFSTVSMFVHDYGYTNSSDVLKTTISTNNGYNFLKMADLAPQVNRAVEYHPFIGTIVGVFLIFSLVKAGIEIGIRMFKLLILEIIAPIAIITCVGDGLKSSTFQTFYKKYLSVWAEAFMRMLIMLIVIVFVCKFYMNIEDFIGTLSDAKGITKALITILVVVSAFKFASSVPKFIDEALGTKLSSGNDKNFLGSILGAGLGALGGAAAGFAAGSGFFGKLGGAAGNALLGGITGGQSGGKGNTVAEFFKNNSEAAKTNRERARNIARQGGLLQYGLMNAERGLGISQGQHLSVENIEDSSKSFENMLAARADALSNVNSGHLDRRGGSIKFGNSADEYADKMLEYDQATSDALMDFETIQRDTTATSWTDRHGITHAYSSHAEAVDAARNAYLAERDRAKDRYKQEYNTALFHDGTVNGNRNVQEATRVYDRRALDGQSSSDIGASSDIDDTIKQIKYKDKDRSFKARLTQAKTRGAERRSNRQGGFGG